MSLAFILIWIVIVGLIARDWGFSGAQRLLLIGLFIGLQLIVLFIVAVLASKSGDPLYSPYERSLRDGTQYGTDQTPITYDEDQALPGQTQRPGLTRPPQTSALRPRRRKRGK